MDKSLAANGAMHAGIERFLSKYPLLGALAASWNLAEDATLQSMAVAADDPGIKLLYNSAFVMSLTPDELVGVLHHEARHCVFGHIFMEPEKYPDERALIIAQEVTVNENLPEPLPSHPILLKQHPKLPKDEDTDTRYRRLAGSSSKKTPQNSVSASGRRPLDDHSRWESFWGNESVTKMLVEAGLKEALEKLPVLSPDEESILNSAEKTCGSEPGTWLHEVRYGKPATLNWQTLLRRFVGSEISKSYSYAVPPRRFPHLLGLVPGSRRSGEAPVIQAVIDTSGSISDAILADISKELANLARDFEVVVVEADTKVHRVYKYTKPIINVIGRGGTSFIPALKHSVLCKTQAELVLYFTDGYGPAPTEPPQIPVAWVLTRDGVPPAQWGRVIYMGRKPSTPGQK